MDDLPHGAELLIADCWGSYIPQRFAEHYSKHISTSIPSVAWTILKDGPNAPDGDLYWDTWDYVLSNATFKSASGKEYTLYQDGDLWLTPTEE